MLTVSVPMMFMFVMLVFVVAVSVSMMPRSAPTIIVALSLL